jgi:YesN/AraC family two-component response regulator
MLDNMIGEIMLVSKKNQFSLNEKQKNKIAWMLQEIVEGKQSFIQPQYSLGQLSADMGFSRNVLSAFFNQTMGIHFNDYINQLRVHYCKHLIANGHAHLLTLEGLAQKSGFYNRNTFTTAFKKFTGVTPSYYIRQLAFD